MFELGSDWKFKDVQDNIEALKSQYDGVLMLFLWFQTKERTKVIHETKVQIFSYENIQYWQRERLWEVLNGDFSIEEFRRLK